MVRGPRLHNWCQLGVHQKNEDGNDFTTTAQVVEASTTGVNTSNVSRERGCTRRMKTGTISRRQHRWRPLQQFLERAGMHQKNEDGDDFTAPFPTQAVEPEAFLCHLSRGTELPANGQNDLC